MNEKQNPCIAIYSRKSRFTGKGESIENQIELCKKYIDVNYPDTPEENIFIYEDEGFSGGNTERPQFKKMMEDARKKKFSVIICYRLDRISRNIGDFAKLIDEFKALKISFESIKEKFDTDSSLGRAMMYIASVFSQLERETIAERIRDNMHELAKTGRWLGGNTPTGYQSTQVQKVTVDGKKRRAYKLDIVQDEMELVKTIYSRFLEMNSLTKVETYLIQNHMKTKMGKDFTRFSIKAILQNPVYMIADMDAWNYYEKLGVELYAEKTEFDGKHGVMAYNKTIQQAGKANQFRNMDEWIIAVGKHEGVISGKEWVTVQNYLEQNASKAYRKPKSTMALLSGLLYCGHCGSYMRPKVYNTDYAEGEKRYSYLCEMKEKSRMQECNMKNPNGNVLDRAICEEAKKLSENSSEFVKQLEESKKAIKANTGEYDKRMEHFKNSLSDNENEIKALVSKLAETEGTAANGYITDQINELHEKNESIKKSIEELESLTKENVLSHEEFDFLRELLSSFASTFDTMTIEQKRMAIRNFVKKIVWDGENVHVYLFGANEDEIKLPNEAETEPLRGGSK